MRRFDRLKGPAAKRTRRRLSISAILQLSILFMFNILGTACFMKVELSGAAGASGNANNGVGAAGDNRSESGSQHSEDALLD